MAFPEDAFYEIATREVTANRLAAAIWGRAFSDSDGDMVKAQALYIKLRVEQLTRLFSESSTEEYLRQIWPEVKRGDNFVCPTCKRLTTIKTVHTDFFVKQLFSGAITARYYCNACNDELATVRRQVGGGPGEASPHRVSASSTAGGKSNNGMAVTGFVLGLASAVLYVIGIVPILAVVFSGIGLATFKPETQKNRWMAGVGLTLGVVYLIMMLSHYGHLK